MSKIQSSNARSRKAKPPKRYSPKDHSRSTRSRKWRAPEISGEPASDSDKPERSPRELAAAWFGLHRVCVHRACRRAKRCCGGATPWCFTACWRHIPERDKVEMRAVFTARGDGASVADAMAAGAAAVAKWEALEARLAPKPPAELSPRRSAPSLRQNARRA